MLWKVDGVSCLGDFLNKRQHDDDWGRRGEVIGEMERAVLAGSTCAFPAAAAWVWRTREA